MKRIVHIITNLKGGGAQGVLYRLCKHDLENHHSVISLFPGERYDAELRRIGVEVYSPGIRGLLSIPTGFLKTYFYLRRRNPQIVQTWLYHADLIGSLAARVAGVRRVVWCIRRTSLEKGRSKTVIILLAKLLSFLSAYLPTHLIFCATSARRAHARLGYDIARSTVIFNGFDDVSLPMDRVLAGTVRNQLSVGQDVTLLGSVGRYDPQKDYPNLFEALAIMRRDGAEVRCLLVGAGLEQSNSELLSVIEHYGIADSVELLGPMEDIAGFMNALDLFVLPSSSEGFPNVVAEAMMCGTPCVTTDVGDAARIVGSFGWVVPPRNSVALADGITKALSEMNHYSWQGRCSSCREHIRQEFQIQTMVGQYQKVWSEQV